MNRRMKEKRAELLYELDALWNVCSQCEFSNQLTLEACKQCKVFTAISSYEGDLICLTAPRKYEEKHENPFDLLREKIKEMRKQGMTFNQISFQLGIKPNTIKYHIKRWEKEGTWDESELRYYPTFEEVRTLYDQGQGLEEIAELLSEQQGVKISRYVLKHKVQKWRQQGIWKRKNRVTDAITPEEVRKLKAEGKTQFEISESIGMRKNYVANLIAKWRKQGIDI